MMKREQLTRYLDELLESARFSDYCPNGLQVEGRGEVQRIVAGVTASQALVDAAIAREADTLLVHHGWFWRGEDGRVTGFRKARMQALLKHDIKVEPPDGDTSRLIGPAKGDLSSVFITCNQGKRAIALDLKQPAAIDLLHRFIARADVLVENFRPGVMTRLGLDHATLSAENPRLIYASISGFGQDDRFGLAHRIAD